MADDPKLRVVSSEAEERMSIPKPEEKFSLDRFKSKLDTSGGSVDTLNFGLADFQHRPRRRFRAVAP